MLLLGSCIASTVNVVPHLNILTEFQNSHANRSTILSTFGNVYASAGLEALCFQVVRLLCVCVHAFVIVWAEPLSYWLLISHYLAVSQTQYKMEPQLLQNISFVLILDF